MARKPKKTAEKQINPDHIADALAKAVATGDVVNLQFVFSPASPARQDSPEQFESDKYTYLLPTEDEAAQAEYQTCRAMVREPATWSHISGELEANRPSRIPWQLVMRASDNAVRMAKYTSAAQGYEQLRIRRRMQSLLRDQGNAALSDNDLPRALRAYAAAVGLSYDYGAFPEPLPLVSNFQTKALMLHAEYPEASDKGPGMLVPEAFAAMALNYLLDDDESIAQILAHPLDVQMGFLEAWVRHADPAWTAFVDGYKASKSLLSQVDGRLLDETQSDDLADEIAEMTGPQPQEIEAALLGRTIENGQWWQYLKEIAYEHPAAPLFLARQRVGDREILVPRHADDAPAAKALGLA